MTDLELCQFLDRGYHILQPDGIRATVHDEVYDVALRLHTQRREISNPLASLGAISDNLHVSVPCLNEILDSPVLEGALSSVLGERYFRYPHSFIHESGPHDQTFHKDSPLPWGSRGAVRSHRPNWAMIFYYPQETTIEMGATEILPGTQYWNVDREHDDRPEGEDRLAMDCTNQQLMAMAPTERDTHLYASVPELDRLIKPFRLEVPKGSLVLVHFDLFHRGTRRTSTATRYMYKFWYLRTQEPTKLAPPRKVRYSAEDSRRQSSVANHAMWLGLDVLATDVCEIEESAGQDADLLANYYQRVKTDTSGVVHDLCSGQECLRRNAMYALLTQEQHAEDAARTLSSSNSVSDRCRSAYLLGETASFDEESISILEDFLDQKSPEDVRMNAANAMGRLVRRALETEFSHALVARCVQTLLNALSQTRNDRTRTGIVRSSLRQCIYIALLNIVTPSLTKEGVEDVVESVAREVCVLVANEEDRFAKGTAIEILARLAEAGIPEAVQASLNLLRHERWSAVDSA